MSRRFFVSIAAALALAPLSAFAADGSSTHMHMQTNCSHVAAKSTASSATAKPAAVNPYQGATRAELERIWSALP